MTFKTRDAAVAMHHSKFVTTIQYSEYDMRQDVLLHKHRSRMACRTRWCSKEDCCLASSVGKSVTTAHITFRHYKYQSNYKSPRSFIVLMESPKQSATKQCNQFSSELNIERNVIRLLEINATGFACVRAWETESHVSVGRDLSCSVGRKLRFQFTPN